jgi:plastocyanin
MRPRPLVPAGLAVLALAILPASALAGPTVVANEDSAASRDFFTPSTPTIPLSDSVTFTNGVGQHNVAWDAGGFPTKPSLEGTTSPWTFSRKFTTPGVYRFYCTVHGGPGGQGMSGKVTVLLANGSVPKAPAVGRVTTTPGRGQVTLRFTSSSAGTAKGNLTRRQGRSFRGFGAVKLSLRTGSNKVKLTKTNSGRRLVKGTYQLALSFSDGVSNLTTAKTFKFTISR